MPIRYHLSKKFLGNRVTLTPKVPGSAIESFEGNIPRVCFSTNVFHCVRGICGCASLQCLDLAEFKDKSSLKLIIINPAIYKTNKKLYLPPSHADFRSNTEHWSIDSIDVTFIGYLCLNSLLERKILVTDNLKTLNIKTYLKI